MYGSFWHEYKAVLATTFKLENVDQATCRSEWLAECSNFISNVFLANS